MFSVTSDTASSASLQNARSKSARDEQPSSDSFSSLVDSNIQADPGSRAPAPSPEQPAAAPRDDRSARADDSSRSNERNNAARDARDQDSQAAGDRADAAQDSKAETAATAKSNSKSTSKSTDKTDVADTKTDTDKDPVATTADGQTVEAAPVDAAKAEIAVPATAVAVTIPVPVPVVATDATALPVAPENAGATQPAAIAAAVLKAQAAATEAGTAIPAAVTDAEPTVPAAAEPDFAALIAAASPVVAKSGVKSTEKTTEVAAKAPADAEAETGDAAPATTAGQPIAAETKPAADAKPAEVPSETAKPDATATDAAAKPVAHAAREHLTAEPAVTPAPADLGPTSNNMQPQPLQAAAPAALTAQQLTANIATNAPVPLNGLAVEIAQSAKAGNSRFDIRLDPAELGRIDVRLDVDRHGNVTSHLTVEKAETLALLRQDAPQLQRALEQAGMKTSDGGLQFSLRDQSSGQQNSGDNSARQSQRLIISEDESMPAVTAGRNYGRMLGSSRGIDISI